MSEGSFGRCCCTNPPDHTDWHQVIAYAWWPGFLPVDLCLSFANANGYDIEGNTYYNIPQYGHCDWMAVRRKWDLQGKYSQTKYLRGVCSQYEKTTTTSYDNEAHDNVTGVSTLEEWITWVIEWSAEFGDLTSATVETRRKLMAGETVLEDVTVTKEWDREADGIFIGESEIFTVMGLTLDDDVPRFVWVVDQDGTPTVMIKRSPVQPTAPAVDIPPSGSPGPTANATTATYTHDYTVADGPVTDLHFEYAAGIELSIPLTVSNVADTSDALLGSVALNDLVTNYNVNYGTSPGGGAYFIQAGDSDPNRFSDVVLTGYFSSPGIADFPPIWTNIIAVAVCRDKGTVLTGVGTLYPFLDPFDNPVEPVPERISGRGAPPWEMFNIERDDPDETITDGVNHSGGNNTLRGGNYYFQVELPEDRSWYDYPEPDRALCSIKTSLTLVHGLNCGNAVTVCTDNLAGIDFESIYPIDKATGEREEATCGAGPVAPNTGIVFNPTTFQAHAGSGAIGDSWVNPITEGCDNGAPFDRPDCCP